MVLIGQSRSGPTQTQGPPASERRRKMKQTAMMRRLAVLVGTALVAVLALSGLAGAATTPLAVTKAVPAGGAAEVSPTANVNHDMNASTITSSTFKIRKQGTTTWLGATRSVNNTISPTSTNGSSQSVATLNPNSELTSNSTYQVVVVGGSSGVKDLNGNALSANKIWTFTTVAPPETTIDPNTGPTGTVASTSASFSFSSSKPNSTFKCSLDGSAFSGCASPKNYPGPLSQGDYTFRVRAIDATGTPDSTPASRTWTVVTAPIEATPSTVDFGGFAYCPLDPSPVENVTLKNITTEPITVVPSVSGTDASSFSVPTDQITLAPGDTTGLPVTFTPSGAWGSRTASLELKDAGGNSEAGACIPGARKAEGVR